MRGAVYAGLIREPIDYSYEACMEESRLVMLTCAKGAMKAANVNPREALSLDCISKNIRAPSQGPSSEY